MNWIIFIFIEKMVQFILIWASFGLQLIICAPVQFVVCLCARCFDVDSDVDALMLANAAQIVRRDMFKRLHTFDGSFGAECQKIHSHRHLLIWSR